MRWWRWILGAAALLVVLVAATIAALPLIVRAGLVHQIRSLTGRDARIESVRLNVFTGWYNVRNLRIGGRPGEPPLLEVGEIDLRLLYRYLLQGQVRSREIAFRSPVLRLARVDGGRLDIDDILARLRGGPERPGEPIDIVAELIVVSGGRVFIEDRAVAPAQAFELRDLTISLAGISTRQNSGQGTGTLTGVLDGTPLAITAEEIRVRPARGRARFSVVDFDLARLTPYVPPGATLRPTGGRLGGEVHVLYDAQEGIVAAAEGRLADLTLVRPGQEEPYLTVPVAQLSARDVVIKGATIAPAFLELTAAGALHDTRAVPPQRFEVASLKITAESPGGRPPTALTLDVALPGGATLETRGHADLGAGTADLAITLTGLDLSPAAALVRGPVTLAGGRLGASLRAVVNGPDQVAVNGELIGTDLLVQRAGQAEALVTHPRLRVTITDLVVRGRTARVARLEAEGAPRILDASVSPPVRVDVTSVNLRVEDATWPAEQPARVSVRSEVAGSGTLAIDGTVHPATLATSVEVRLADVELGRAAPYIPPLSPFTLGRGRMNARLRLGYDAPTLSLDGALDLAGVTVVRRDQAEPVATHSAIRVALDGLTLRDGALALRRLGVSGGPVSLVDASVTPPVRAQFTTLDMTVDDARWPAPHPARVHVEGTVPGGGRGVVRGTFTPSTLAADFQAELAGVDVTPAAPYVPANVPLTLAGGRLGARLSLRHDRASGLRIAGDTAVSDLALARRGESDPLVTDRRLALAVDDLTLKDGQLAVRGLTLTGAPVLVDRSVSPPRRIEVRGVTLRAREITLPGATPGRLELTADLPGSGTLAMSGTVVPERRALDLVADLADADLAPYGPWLPIEAELRGRASAALAVKGALGAGDELRVTGRAGLRETALGPSDRPPLAAQAVDVTGLEIVWPARVVIDRIVLAAPAALIERRADGSFPLRALLTPRSSPSAPASGTASAEAPAAPATPSAAAPAAPATAAGGEPDQARRPAIQLREIALEDGELRFIDHATTPAYSEEISRLAVSVRNAGTSAEPADLAVQGVVGPAAALDLRGKIAPFADPFFLELEGELRDFPLPRTNPYFRRLFAWFLKRGSVTTRVHYRVVGDRLEATNRFAFQRLGVERDTEATDADKKIGLPLGLIVAVATDARGNIEFSVPVNGNLRSPDFSLGDAIWAGVKNVLVNLVTLPFQAVGKLFAKGDEVPEPRVDPVAFAPGSVGLTPEASRHLQRVADVLRSAPNLGLTLRAVVSEADVQSLKGREVTARVQRVQRERALPDFAAAAARLYQDTHPGRPAPGGTDEIVAALREEEPTPGGALRQLAERRVEVTRQALVEGAGVEATRLRPGAPADTPGSGEGRVEFEIGGD